MDIRRMDLCALEELAAQLRSYIIDVVSVRQGHLGSNLGVVELAVALHYVFDTPDEPLVWDVGHQAYAHKILTGRRDAFLHLREYGGISGFPRRDESPYDAFGTGHSSTSVSAVLGMALADKARGIRKNHIAVIGDASIASGMALEALNHAAGAADADMLVVLNDNAMGIDPASGALSRHFKTLLEDRAQDNIFRAMGVKYFKISDGHDIKELVGTLSEIKNVPGVKLLPCAYCKGKKVLKRLKRTDIISLSRCFRQGYRTGNPQCLVAVSGRSRARASGSGACGQCGICHYTGYAYFQRPVADVQPDAGPRDRYRYCRRAFRDVGRRDGCGRHETVCGNLFHVSPESLRPGDTRCRASKPAGQVSDRPRRSGGG